MDLPRRYGHYVLLERIAVGGMGEIFRASYAGLAGFERQCAIKRILPHLSDDEEFTDRLISEAKIAVQLTHGNIVQVYELGRIENEYFIAMEWVDGPDLSSLQVKAKAKDQAMPLPVAIHVIHEVARAVDYAHRKEDAQGKPLDIVHRDISPQNVMISRDGAVKLGDFGIARAGGMARKFVTGMGAVLGKRRYMSPEQRRGEMVDARTDVYALGALLHECVTGFAPDPDGERVSVSILAGDIPPELAAITDEALEPDSDKRLASAGVLAERLERVFVRMASVPGAPRDASLELGRYVQRIFPPGEKAPAKRSLTDRMRAAMPPGFDSESVSGPDDITGTNAVPVMRASGPSEVTAPGPVARVASEVGAPIAGMESPDESVTLVLSTASVLNASLRPPASGGSKDAIEFPPREIHFPPSDPPASAATSVVPGNPANEPTTGRPRDRLEDRPTTDPSAPDRAMDRAADRPTASPDDDAGRTTIRPVPVPRRPSPSGARPPVQAPSFAQTAATPDNGISSPSGGETMILESPFRFAPGANPAPAPARPAAPKSPFDVSPRAVRGFMIGAGFGVGTILVGLLLYSVIEGFGGSTAEVTPTPFARTSVMPTPFIPTPTKAVAVRTTPRATDTPRPTETPRPRLTPTARPTATPVPTRTRVAIAATPVPTPRADAVATLNIGAPAIPWGYVFVDGKRLEGTTPKYDVKVRPGKHVIVVENPKFGRREVTINVKADETRAVMLDFK